MAERIWHPRALLGLVKRAIKGWVADKATSMGAALAFYSLLSLAPLLIVVITVTGLVLGREGAEQLLMTQINDLVGERGAEGIATILRSVDTEREGILATVIGGATLLLGATTVFAELKSDLDRIWKYTAPKAAGLWGFIRTRILSFGLVMAIAFLLLVSLVVSSAVSAAGKHWFGGFEAVLHIIDFVAAWGVTTLLFAMIYKLLPGAKIAWGDVWIGAAFTALLFGIGKFLIGLYLGKSDVVSSFGNAGTLVLVIMWVFYSAQVFFLGAEFTYQYSIGFGSKRGEAGAPAVAANDPGHVPGDAALVSRARRIVKGKDPVLEPKPGKRKT